MKTNTQVETVRKTIVEYAKAQGLPWYCQRGDNPRKFAADVVAGRPVPPWVLAAVEAAREGRAVQ